VDGAPGTTEATRHPARRGLDRAIGGGSETMLDNEFPSENNVLLHELSVAEHGGSGVRPSFQREQAMRNPKPFTVFQTIPGQHFPKQLFIVHCYSLAQAQTIVAAKVAGETIVVGPVSLDTKGAVTAPFSDGASR
jgi:hypothetical protein